MRALLLVAPLLAGCPVPASLVTGYRPSPASLRPAPLDGGLAVHRFDDARPARVYSTQGRALIAMIPLVPWASLPFERLDEPVQLQSKDGAPPTAPDYEQYTYPASFARAVADDLAAAGLFNRVVYTGRDNPPGYRYVLDGTILETPLVHSK